ncbi:TPA: tail fiber domain-containing protein [Klebsiella pneumoniae]|uniref:tail fiber domain-containing protein n=1 Tax=Klebsiella TaxID=570 RepID=UPI0024DEF4FE|nr:MULTISPECIES: tail fiber domain-containing protein [unclassified Klebsiella]EKZ6052476.1 tail fiber domain-containing protein [Klebsiella variicola]MCS6029535.1 tail fiber domain-containing protein [Klebsiella quasipneumoniae subsp. quasipneumoniae]HBW4526039.1 tail fiber domain-containing protein [Klebsiella pneumoniae]MDK1755132.1 tail fiber domain-containing protein [Klebsiella sp. K5-322]MDK1839668.1 tail fiber domain-containing protein [Klebsiella sp. K5-204]
MAIISDQLAADIHNAFSKYYTDLANQDQIFFGVGDVTITKQDGTTATVRSWNKVIGAVDTAAQRGTVNTFTALQTFSAGINVSAGNINVMNDNSMIILGKNSDLALLKKSGQGGTIAVGSGTPFKVQRASTATVAPGSTYEDIFVIGVDKQTTLPGPLSAGGNINNTSKGKVLTQAIELSMSTPYIDFHFNGSAADYTTRLIEATSGELTLEGAFMCKKHLYTWGEVMARNIAPSSPANGTLVTAAPLKSMLQGRGGNGDSRGAYAGFYLEELVGSEHRAVIYLDGYSRTDAWIFHAGGTISTGKGDVMTTGSDMRLKEGFTEAPENALQRIERLGVCEYQMKGENRRRRGFIAQQADTVDTTYTFMGCEQEIDGVKFQVMNVDYVAIIADLVSSVQELRMQLTDLAEMNKSN